MTHSLSRSRSGAIGVLIVIIIALVAGAAIAVVVLNNGGAAGLREQIDTLIGPSPVKGNVLSVKDGTDRNQPSFALVKLDEPQTYSVGDTFLILQGSKPVAKGIVQSVTEKGEFLLRVDADSWLIEKPTGIKKGDDVRARRAAKDKDKDKDSDQAQP